MERKTILLFYLIASMPISFFTVSFLYDYVTWIEPLNNITSDDILFLDKGTHQGSYDETHFPSMKNITYVDDGSALIEFQSHKFNNFIQDDIDYVATINQRDMLIVDCRKESRFSATFAQTYLVTVLNKTYVEFYHYDLTLPINFQCKYPEIIEYGLDMDWPDFYKPQDAPN